MISDSIISYVNKAGGIEKVRALLVLFRNLDKNDPEVVRQFVARMGTDASPARALCSAALLGLSIADFIYTAASQQEENKSDA